MPYSVVINTFTGKSINHIKKGQKWFIQVLYRSTIKRIKLSSNICKNHKRMINDLNIAVVSGDEESNMCC